MKVMIEIDLPEGQQIPRAEDILKLTSHDWLIEKWHFSDMQTDNPWLTDDQAREALGLVEKYHDANIGINWIMIDTVINENFEEPEEEETK